MAELSEKEKEKIKVQSKKILDGFSNALSKVRLEKKEFKKPLGGFREEGAGKAPGSDFREAMFANAPNKNKDCLIAEKKSW
jgi:Asp-tRNA(Asn)/Glu-tRNA(Gln) amidotransferase C subunit